MLHLIWQSFALTKPVFIGLVVAALILPYIPIINWPFSWLESYFHEISHGLVGVLTGGSIHGIELALNGSGVCYVTGGIPLLVSFSGYLGAVGWGMLIYVSSLRDRYSVAKNSLGVMAVGIALSLGLWGKDFVTYVIGVFMVVLLMLLLRFRSAFWVSFMVKFCGIYIMVSAVRSPLALIDGKDVGDGAYLAQLTGIPELLWVLGWEALALLALWVSWQLTLQCQQKQQKQQKRGIWGR